MAVVVALLSSVLSMVRGRASARFQARQPRRWEGRQDSADGHAQRLIQPVQIPPGIERDRQTDTGPPVAAPRQIAFGFRLVNAAIETTAPAVLMGSRFKRSAARQLDLVGMLSFECQLAAVGGANRSISRPAAPLLQSQGGYPLEVLRVGCGSAPQPPSHAAHVSVLANGRTPVVKKYSSTPNEKGRCADHPARRANVGRHLGRRAVGQPNFFLQQIGH